MARDQGIRIPPLSIDFAFALAGANALAQDNSRSRAMRAAHGDILYDKGVKFSYDDFNGDAPDAKGTPRISGPGNVSFCELHRPAPVPDFSLTATTELRIPTSGAIAAFVRGLVTYRRSVYAEQDDYIYPSRTLIDLFVGLRTQGEREEISAFAKNLLSQSRVTKIYASNAITATQSGAPYDSGDQIVSVTNPREIGVTSAFRFQEDGLVNAVAGFGSRAYTIRDRQSG